MGRSAACAIHPLTDREQLDGLAARRVLALIVAAGTGERLGAGMPKALVELRGKTLLQRSADVLLSCERVSEVIVALPTGIPAPSGTLGVLGGQTRSQSVRHALQVASEGDPADIVLVHDAARPMVTLDLVEALIEVMHDERLEAAVAGVPVTDTVKRAQDHVVTETLDRSELWAVQTPQAFKRHTLQRVLDQPYEVLAKATDDASLVEQQGGAVAIVPSSPENLKVTTPLDLEIAGALLDLRDQRA